MSRGADLRGFISRTRAVAAFAFLSITLVAPSGANETTTYTYDALGRLVRTDHGGTVNSGANTGYTYDRAGNRTNVIVSTGGASGGGNGSNTCTFSVSDPYAGNYHGGTLAFIVSKQGSCSDSSILTYASRDGTAQAGVRYFAVSGSITFAPNETSKTINVLVAGGSSQELDMFLDIAISNGVGTIADGTGLGFLYDDS